MRFLAVLVCALCLSSVDSGVRFAVAEGTSLKKTFEIKSKATMTKMEYELDGQPLPAPDLSSKDIYAEQEREIVVKDDYLKLGAGRPEVLRRTYSKLTGHTHDRMALMGPGGKPKEESLSSELQGATVLFTWNEKERSYKPSFAGAEGNRRLLGGLEEDLDLRLFLPARDVAEGDSWKVPPETFDDLFRMGGRLGLEADEDNWFERGLAEILKGDIVVKYARSGDGVAQLPITADLSFDGQVEDQRTGQPVDVEGTVRMEGRLDWDTTGGHFRAVDLDVRMLMGMHVSGTDPRGELEAEMGMDWTMSLSGRAEPVP